MPTNGKSGSGSSVAKVSEISARSTRSFEDAMQNGIARAAKTLRNLNSAWVKDQRVEVKGGKWTGNTCSRSRTAMGRAGRLLCRPAGAAIGFAGWFGQLAACFGQLAHRRPFAILWSARENRGPRQGASA